MTKRPPSWSASQFKKGADNTAGVRKQRTCGSLVGTGTFGAATLLFGAVPSPLSVISISVTKQTKDMRYGTLEFSGS